MNRHEDIVATLRQLDPADRHVDPASARARADLRAILATDPTPPAGPAPGRSLAAGRPWRRPTTASRRVALVVGTLAAATVGVVALPPLTGEDQAMATWIAAPSDLPAAHQAQAAEDCREAYRDAPGASSVDLARAEPVIAERRGEWTTVVLAGADGFSAMCITDDSTAGMFGGYSTPTRYVAPGAREFVVDSIGVGTTGAGDISMVAGTSGVDVVGVVYRSVTHGDVVATVNGGHFALWFPGDELANAHIDGVEVEVTFTDGTTATVWLGF